MCTVSFVAGHGIKFFTSNRDEHQLRPPAFAPAVAEINGTAVIFPKDSKAGGTWFAANERGGVVVLLNGAFVKHVSEGPYRRSRGLVLLDVVSAENATEAFHALDLDNIEPFTLVVFESETLHELRWDGSQRHAKPLDPNGAFIWSSATLYTPETIAHRERLFHAFLEKEPAPDAEAILSFHRHNHQDFENGFVIDRGDGMKTQSVTQAVLAPPAPISLRHLDLSAGQTFLQHLPLRQLAPTRFP